MREGKWTLGLGSYCPLNNLLVKVQSALISVFHKEGLEDILSELKRLKVDIYSTGGTYDFIKNLGYEVTSVEDLTTFPSILGGRVKTLHPKVFGGILNRRSNLKDSEEVEKYDLPSFDLVIVDLYPFDETVRQGASVDSIIEKIDIGGISLIRAAAKNYTDVVVICAKTQYKNLTQLLRNHDGITDLDMRKSYAKEAFRQSGYYDNQIAAWFSGTFDKTPDKVLRYGENPHQKAIYKGNLDEVFDQLHGKELSYNNLVDVDAALLLLEEFNNAKACVIIKHTNPCGVAVGNSTSEAFSRALACDNVSAFGGIIAINQPIDLETAELLDAIFFELLIAPSYSKEAMEILSKKKNRILLQLKQYDRTEKSQKTILNGILEQESDTKSVQASDLKFVTEKHPTDNQVSDMLFANKIVKNAKSNTIVIAKDGQLLGIGVGQTSRVDALKQAIAKSIEFGFDIKEATMASDAFFPFPDCVKIAHEHGIESIIQPGGSIKDQESVDYCNQNNIAMVMTGFRHFKH